MFEIFSNSFMQNALIACVLISISAGFIGSLIVANRMVFLSGALAHSTYGGVGIAVYFSLPLLPILGIFTVFCAFILFLFLVKFKYRTDTFIAFLWSGGMALGIILIDFTNGYNVDLQSYLFGNILAVSKEDLYFIFILDLIVIFFIFLLYEQFLALSYDEEFLKLKGLNANFLKFFLLILIAISIVVAMRLVGLIMLMSLLTIPVFIAESLSNTLFKTMILSVALSLIFSVSGLILSYFLNISSGACIIALSSLFFLSFFIVRAILKKY